MYIIIYGYIQNIGSSLNRSCFYHGSFSLSYSCRWRCDGTRIRTRQCWRSSTDPCRGKTCQNFISRNLDLDGKKCQVSGHYKFLPKPIECVRPLAGVILNHRKKLQIKSGSNFFSDDIGLQSCQGKKTKAF